MKKKDESQNALRVKLSWQSNLRASNNAAHHIRYINRDIEEEIKAVHSTRAPPLPIPNREVKPRRADGTAKAGE